MTFINNNKIFLQKNRFDFLLFLVTSFYCTIRIIKITFPKSRYCSLKFDIKESFIVQFIAMQFQFFRCHIVMIQFCIVHDATNSVFELRDLQKYQIVRIDYTIIFNKDIILKLYMYIYINKT